MHVTIHRSDPVVALRDKSRHRVGCGPLRVPDRGPPVDYLLARVRVALERSRGAPGGYRAEILGLCHNCAAYVAYPRQSGGSLVDSKPGSKNTPACDGCAVAELAKEQTKGPQVRGSAGP